MIRRKHILPAAIASFTFVALVPSYSSPQVMTGRDQTERSIRVVEHPSSASLRKAFKNLSDLFARIADPVFKKKCTEALGELEEALLAQQKLYDERPALENERTDTKILVEAVNNVSTKVNTLLQKVSALPETPPEPLWAVKLPAQVATEVNAVLEEFLSKPRGQPQTETDKVSNQSDKRKNEIPGEVKKPDDGKQQTTLKEVSPNREPSDLPAVLIVMVVVLGFTGIAIAGVFWKKALEVQIDRITESASGKVSQRGLLPRSRPSEPWPVGIPDPSSTLDLEKRLESHRQQLTGEVRSLFSLHVGEGKLDRMIELCEQLVSLMHVSQAALQTDGRNPSRFQSMTGAMAQENWEPATQSDQPYRELGSIQGLCERILKQLPHAREALEVHQMMLKDLQATGDAIIRQGREARELINQEHANVDKILQRCEEVCRRLPDAGLALERHKELVGHFQPILSRMRKQDLERRNWEVRSYYVKLAEEIDRRIGERESVREDENAVHRVRAISGLLAQLWEQSPEDLKNVIGRAKEGADQCLQPMGRTVNLRTKVMSCSTIMDVEAMTQLMLNEDTETLVNSESYRTFPVKRVWVSDMENSIVVGNERQFREDILEFLKTHHSAPGSTAKDWLDQFQEEGFFRLLDHVEARMKIHGIHNEEVVQIIRSILDELELKEMEIRPMQDTFDSRLHERGKTYPTERFGHNTVLGVMRIGILTKDGQSVKRKARVGVAMEPKAQ